LATVSSADAGTQQNNANSEARVAICNFIKTPCLGGLGCVGEIKGSRDSVQNSSSPPFRATS
jgi:hypothetical protein